MSAFLKKLSQPRILKRVLVERLSEPLHLNLLTLPVAVFGSLRWKVEFDLVLRPYHAYGLLSAADRAAKLGLPAIKAVEFGVAAGAGLMNMAHIAQQVTRATGVKINIYGFDTGQGMPPPVDHRDHPDLYWEGCFPMDHDALRAKLPAHAHLILGDLDETVPGFVNTLTPDAPLGYASIDVDYYSSTVKALRLFTGPAETCLPCTYLYLDDIMKVEHNHACGELLAVDEFNAQHPLRRIEPERFIRSRRIFKKAPWLDQIFILHTLDHPSRASTAPRGEKQVLENPYL
ncbi:MAG: hypothetical protein GC164_02330 [Phycisphaera sp.]|nr:hypothetical protein [Phycisphaera sp.]